jgi:hypothetical protein
LVCAWCGTPLKRLTNADTRLKKAYAPEFLDGAEREPGVCPHLVQEIVTRSDGSRVQRCVRCREVLAVLTPAKRRRP